MINKEKKLGQVFTPRWVIDEILDSIGYTGETILNKHIMEPASGDGAFLLVIVERYINAALQAEYKPRQIKADLEKYIHAIELDTVEYKKSIENLNKLVRLKFKNVVVKWQIYNANTLSVYKEHFSSFDFIVGNPPYIRIHNLDVKTREFLKKEFLFADGTIDIYLSFFEMGFRMLKKDGILGFITPNSFLHNSSYKRFREYLKKTEAVKTLVDFKSNKVFDGFSTYTAISIIQFNNLKGHFAYKELVKDKIETIADIHYKDLSSSDWSLANSNDLKFIKELKNNKNKLIQDYFNVQYGFATLRDKIFIGDIKEYDNKKVYFNNELIEKEILRKIIKGSTFKGNSNQIKYILFPYVKKNDRYIAIDESDLRGKFPLAYQYLSSRKNELLERDLDKGSHWYEFGRSQGVQTIHNEKIVCSTLMKDAIIFHKLPADVMCYSGIFISKKDPHTNWDILLTVLNSEKFKRYITITGKNFSGGYKSITSKQIKQFKLEELSSSNLFS